MELTKISLEVYEKADKKVTLLPKLEAVPRAALAPATLPNTAMPRTGINNPTKKRQCSGMHKDLNSKNTSKATRASLEEYPRRDENDGEKDSDQAGALSEVDGGVPKETSLKE